MSSPSYKNQTKFFGILSLLIVIVLGVWGSMYAGEQIKKNDLNSLLLRVKNIALLVDATKIKTLEGSLADLDKVEYQNLKFKLTQIHGVNDDTRFVYLMGLNNNQQFFYVDSENPSSVDYSPPGQPYTDATDMDINNHKNGISYTDGPYSDEWGTWISAYAPVINPETNMPIAMVGMDVKADQFNSHVLFAKLTAALVFLLIFICLLLIVLMNNRTVQYVEELEKSNQDLQSNKDYLTEAEQIAKLGQLSWSSVTKDVMMNKIIMDILGSSASKISLDKFIKYIDEEDLNRIKEEFLKIDLITTSLNFKYKLKGSDGKVHSMISTCKIKRDAKGDISRVVCTAQDMTGTL